MGKESQLSNLSFQRLWYNQLLKIKRVSGIQPSFLADEFSRILDSKLAIHSLMPNKKYYINIALSMAILELIID